MKYDYSIEAAARQTRDTDYQQNVEAARQMDASMLGHQTTTPQIGYCNNPYGVGCAFRIARMLIEQKRLRIEELSSKEFMELVDEISRFL